MIHALKANFPIAFMCRCLGISRSAYYAWEKRPLSEKAKEDARLLEKIKKSHKDSFGTYGSPRITDDLKEQGETAGLLFSLLLGKSLS